MLAPVNEQQSTQTVRTITRARARRPGILVADDMGLILTLLKLELEERGCDVWTAANGAAALEVYRQRRAEIDLVLLDVQMPGLDGPSTLSALREIYPYVCACFMSSNSGAYTEFDLLERGAAWVFNKPFRTAEVAHLIQAMLRVSGLLSADDWDAFVCER